MTILFRPGKYHDKNEKLIFHKTDLDLAVDKFETSLNITLPSKARNNGTFWSRVVLYPTGKQEAGVQAFGKMISHQVPIRYANLLGDETAKEKGILDSETLCFFSREKRIINFVEKRAYNRVFSNLLFSIRENGPFSK